MKAPVGYAAAATIKDVRDLYNELLGRPPESEQAAQQWVGKPVVTVAIAIAKSDEYRARLRPTSREDVLEIYRRFLKRDPEEIAIVERVGRSVIDVVLEIAQSAEFLGKQGAATKPGEKPIQTERKFLGGLRSQVRGNPTRAR